MIYQLKFSRRTLLNKVRIFTNLWGIRFTLFKILGRLRPSFIRFPKFVNQDIAIIGCGQFAYSNLAPKLLKFGIFSPILCAYDKDKVALKTFSTTYSCYNLRSFPNIELDKKTKLAYICSDHASHFDYSCYFLSKGIDVYVEKPLTLNENQVYQLAKIFSQSKANLYSGYNRPFSPLIKKIKDLYTFRNPNKFHISCIVKGHKIEPSHWYRSSNQGTRIYGNLVHWIDLSIHTLFWQKILPSKIFIKMKYFDNEINDHNIFCELSTESGYSFFILFFGLLEPLTGVHESVEFISDKFNARIDNFKNLEIDLGDTLKVMKYRKKLAGHKEAIKQPFTLNSRNIKEVFISELLASEIKSMSERRETSSCFNLLDKVREINSIVSKND